jgi:hypothetical protein
VNDLRKQFAEGTAQFKEQRQTHGSRAIMGCQHFENDADTQENRAALDFLDVPLKKMLVVIEKSDPITELVKNQGAEGNDSE